MPPKSRKQKQRHTVQDAIDFFDTDYEEERPITPLTNRNREYRRYCLTSDLARKGAPLRTVQAVLGHEDESTSFIYVKKFGKDMQEQVDRFNPINDV